MTNRTLEYLPLRDVKGAERNPKGHSPEIGESIGRFGYVEPIVLDERTGRLVAGHGRVESLRARQRKGEAPPDGVREQGVEWLVPVLRGWASRSDTEAEAYLLASNQLTIAGGWDDAELGAIIRDLEAAKGLDGVGFDDDEIARLLAAAEGGGATDGLTDPDDVPEEPKDVWVKPGDLFALGRHRLLCGDAAEARDRERACHAAPRLGLHDPPYGISVVDGLGLGDGKRHGGALAKRGTFNQFTGDDKAFEPGHLLGSAAVVFLWGANHYADKLPARASWVVWDKRVDLPSNDFSDCELAWLSVGNSARIMRHTWSGMIRDSERGESRVHPTQKPVALCVEIIEAHTKPDDIVADWYLGSGTTLIAAEKTGRRCCAMELEPLYVQVAIERWEKFTGKKAEKL